MSGTCVRLISQKSEKLELVGITSNFFSTVDELEASLINLYFEYHVTRTDGNISIRIKIEITFIFRLDRRLIQLYMLVHVGFSLTL